MKRLKKLFNAMTATFALATGAAAFPAYADDKPASPQQPAVGCPAFPDFLKPEVPMHRVSRNVTPDPAVEEKQQLLGKLSLSPGRADGRPGTATRMAEREFLLLYGPLYDAGDFDRSLDRTDMAKLRALAGKVDADAAAHKLTKSTAAALRLAHERTGVPMAKLAAAAKTGDGYIDGVSTAGSSVGHLFKFDHTTWLYLVKTHGAKYGLGFYADNITLGQKAGRVTATIANPFIHEQALALKDNKRLSALMAAEYLKDAANVPKLDIPASPAFSARTQAEQKALISLGFNLGSARADGVAGTLTDIARRQWQLLHGEGNPTGVLSEKERSFLLEAAARAEREETAFNVSSFAVGPIRMASTRSGLEFGYMMELAEAESAFVHNIKATTSSATGLYQFIESTWHYMVKTYGHKYGLGAFAAEVELYTDDYGRPQARMANPFVRAGVIEMRKHPHLSSLFSADFQLENKAKELCYVEGGKLSRTDMYLAHFLGAHDAVYFINNKRKNGAKSAVDTFPEAAEYNVNVFYERKPRRERTLNEVYGFFDSKFNKGFYEAPPAPVTPVTPSAPAAKQQKPKR